MRQWFHCSSRTFNSFPVAALTKRTISQRQTRLSILSQLLRKRAEQAAVGFPPRFQFFPSCCRRAQGRDSRRGKETPSFQFFPSCCIEEKGMYYAISPSTLSILSQLLRTTSRRRTSGRLESRSLSILSQLLPYSSAWGGTPTLAPTSFNSFPVAASRPGGRWVSSACFQFFPSCCACRLERGWRRTGPCCFQFFPSCCRGPSARAPRSTPPLSILSQLLQEQRLQRFRGL